MFDQSVVRVRAGTKTDRGGNEIKDWSNPDRAPISDLSVQPATQNEATDPTRTAVVTGWHVLSKPGTRPDVRSGDRIEYQGLTCEVQGEVAEWPSPLGGVHHVEWSMQRATG